MPDRCVFCKIVAGESPGKVVFQDNQVTAFHDNHPAAPTHILIVPNKHITSISQIEPEDEPLIGHLFTVAKQIAENEGISESGYRLIINNGPDANQTVPHIHLHVLGGRPVRYPMG
jgi:histidine triad (HIT) family protein